MAKRRVVVTGMGMVTAVGHSVQENWKNILAGKSGVKEVDFFDTTDISAKISGSVRDFDVSPYLSVKDARKADKFIHYGLAASIQAMEDSGLEITDKNAKRVGVALGSGIGGLPMIEECKAVYLNRGPRKISPFFIPGAIINLLPGHMSIRYGLKGPNLSVVTACSTGTHNIGLAARMIAYGDADAMVCGGAEMATSPLGLAGFAAMRALSTRNDEPEKASRPWDKGRDGFVLGDGAGTLILEEYESAKARGAKIYAELTGFSLNADAYHMTLPEENGEGGATAMQLALDDAGLTADQIDYVNAHGTSTPAGDMLELKGINRVFGEYADGLAVSSTKSMIGHLLGAAGAVEAIYSVLAIRDQIAPPTINLDDPEDTHFNLVPHKAQKMKIRSALSNSFGFGGTNGTLIFSQIDE